jgi:hypothetical protein
VRLTCRERQINRSDSISRIIIRWLFATLLYPIAPATLALRVTEQPIVAVQFRRHELYSSGQDINDAPTNHNMIRRDAIKQFSKEII